MEQAVVADGAAISRSGGEWSGARTHSQGGMSPPWGPPAAPATALARSASWTWQAASTPSSRTTTRSCTITRCTPAVKRGQRRSPPRCLSATMASDSDACCCPPLEMRPPAGCAAAGCEGAARAAGLTASRAATSGRRLANLRPRCQRRPRHRRCEDAKLPPEADRRASPQAQSRPPFANRSRMCPLATIGP